MMNDGRCEDPISIASLTFTITSLPSSSPAPPPVRSAPTYMNACSGRWSHLPSADLLEAADRVGQRRDFARLAGEHLGHQERLREEPLHPPGPVHHQLVLLAQLVHAQDGDDVLQLAVALQGHLHAPGDVVVPLADVLRVEDPAGAGQRIDGRIDALLA